MSRLCGNECAARLGTALTRLRALLTVIVQMTTTFDGARITHLSAQRGDRLSESGVCLQCIQRQGTDVGALTRQPDALCEHV